MGKYKFRYGVSDWTFIFDNNHQIQYNTVIKETTTHYPDGKIEFLIQGIQFPTDILSYFQKYSLVEIKQKIILLDNNSQPTYEELVYTSKDNSKKVLEVESVSYTAILSEIGTSSFAISFYQR